MKSTAVLAALATESDGSISRYSSITACAALVLAWYLSTLDFLQIATIFTQDFNKNDAVVRVKIQNEPKPPVATPTPVPSTQSPGNRQKMQQRGKPRVQPPKNVLAILETRSNRDGYNAYKLLSNANFIKDIDKVLSQNTRLTTRGKTEFGERLGKLDGSFNPSTSFGDGDGTGIADLLPSLIGGRGPTRIATKAHFARIPKPSEISLGAGAGARSIAEIMAVVKARTPGLRNIYNKHLRLNPGMAGKVTLRFTILPGGDVAQCDIVDNTTENSAFASEVQRIVATWRYKVIKSGNTTVTIPFTFTE